MSNQIARIFSKVLLIGRSSVIITTVTLTPHAVYQEIMNDMKGKVKLMSSWLKSGYIPLTIALVMLFFFVSPAIAEASDNLTVTGEILSEAGGDIDLTIGGMVNTVFASAVFCNVPNEVVIRNIKNTGTDTAYNITVAVYDDAISATKPVATTTIPSIAGGKAVSMTKLVDPTLREYEGGTVTYRAVLDPDNLIQETNKDNNEKSSFAKPLKYNGYMGAQYWTGKEEIRTYRTYDLHGNITHSFGNSSYRSGSFGSGWTEYAVGWTAEDLTIPDGATLREARLYLPYCWDNSDETRNVTITFNDAVIPVERDPWEVDQPNFGAYDNHWYGLMTYNVTDGFAVNGENTAVVSRINSNAKLSPAGLTLAVVYEDPLETRKQIFINEGFDLLGAAPTDYGTTEEQATSYQEFTGMTIDMANADNAMLTTFVPWGAAQNAGEPGEGNLFVNGAQIGHDVWNYGEQTTGESNDPQVAVDTRDILAYLNPNGTGNVIAIQSTQGNTPCMVAERAFLVVEYPSEAPVAAFTANLTSGERPLTVQFTDESTGIVTKREWDFGDGNTSTDQNPVHTYTMAGTYTVTLTATGPGGSDNKTKTDYIVVKEPAPAIDFSADPTSGAAPLVVTFTATNTGGKVETWLWSFGDGNTSTDQNPVHTYTAAGTYTVTLTATGSGGSDNKTKTDYITVEEPVAPEEPTGNLTITSVPVGAAIWLDGTDMDAVTNTTLTNITVGEHVVTLKLSGYKEATEEVTIGANETTEVHFVLVEVVEPPVANFTANITSGVAPLTVQFTDTSTGDIKEWLWDFGDGGNSTDLNPTHKYTSDGTYTVTLTTTGSGGSDTLTREHYISVGAATIAVSISSEAIEFGTMKAGVASTGSTAVTVTTTGGPGWSVTASASNGGYMTAGASRLANAFQLANGDGESRAMTTDLVDFMTGTAGESRTDTARVQQAIEKADAPGDYSITLTFTGTLA